MSATPKSRARRPRKAKNAQTPNEAAAPAESPRAPRGNARKGRGRRPAVEVPAEAPSTPEPAPAVHLAEPPVSEPLPPEAFTAPEPSFAARVPPPAPDRPRPTRRRAIFIDVENTSRPGRITDALADLAIDRADTSTDIIASGNWRVIGNETARMLASRGAHLVHSAPATGVRDWSDLRIAVSAGIWLASARAGDRLDIVSDDRAFDAVGDAAAMLGIEFHRHTYRRGAAAHATPAPSAAAPRGRSRRGGRGRRPGAAHVAAPVAEAAPVEVAPAAEPMVENEPVEAPPASELPVSHAADGSAPEEDLFKVVSDALMVSPNGVSIDFIANRLKALGFQRPPGSPRLVTRLRALKELNVSPRGFVTLASNAAASAPAAAPEAVPAAEGQGQQQRRRRRRGGRGRNKPRAPGATE